LKKNITILGAGFIGQHLIRYLLEQSYNIKVLDIIDCPDDFKKKVTWICGSFLDDNSVREAVKGSDILFHLISSTVPGDHVDENEEIRINVTQTNNLLDTCVKECIKRVVFISSASVYGIQNSMPIYENAVTDPISSHGIQKLTIEKYLQLYKYEHALDCKIMRLSNPFGPGQNLNGRQGFIALAIGRILENKPIMIRGDGETIRDFIYIDDVIKACSLLAFRNSQGVVFNIGSGKGYSLNKVISTIEDLLERRLNVEYFGERLVDIPVSVFDIGKAFSILGFKPACDLKEGLRSMLRHYRLL
jgi:UDP-glucose 4-epimerase